MSQYPLDPILKPRSIAVIGASRQPNTIGHQIVRNLVQHGFQGAVFPINPKAGSIHSIRCYATVAELPDAVDLAVISVPRSHVLGVAEDCISSGVKGLVVISAGFREIGPAGAADEWALKQLVRNAGVRMIGPNCMGVLNTDPAIAMNATFAPVMPPSGRVAFVSQSGALGLSVLDYASEYGIGIAQFVSVGNKADVSGNDLLMQWENDPAVDVILMYVESFGNPMRFLEIASRITRRKPIIALKSGRSSAGAGAASSHTGALAANDVAVEALLNQAGVLRASSMEELFDMAMAFTSQPLPRSRRTAVVTNAGGPGILLADAMEAQRLLLPPLAPETVQALQPLLASEASLRNPLDMIASAGADTYRKSLIELLHDPNIDSVVAVFVPPMGVRQVDVAEAVASAAATCPDKPVLAVLMGRAGLPQGRSELQEAGIPAYIFPESAARALAALCKHRERLDRTDTSSAPLDVDRAAAERVIAGARAAGRSRLNEPEALALFEAYGIPVTPYRFVTDADGAAAAAGELGFPVAMKIIAPQVEHKSDVGGVRLGIDSAEGARTAFAQISAAATAAAADLEGVLVQRMAEPGRELIAGFRRDPQFGPLVMFGLGGIFVEALQDVAFRMAPLSAVDAEEMMQQIRGARVLDAFRGQPAVHRDALALALRAIAQIAVDFPEIAEAESNPLLASAAGVVAVDARVSLA